MDLSKVSHADWSEVCKQCRISSIYLDPRWLQLIKEVYPRLKIVRLVCRDDSGRVSWLLPLVEIKPLGKKSPMLISLPFGNYGGFLLPAGVDKIDREALLPLVDFFEKSRAFALELREAEEPVPGFEASDTFKRFEIVFPETTEDLWKRVITGNARTSVRKAEKAGVEVVCDYADDVSVFQQIYEKNASQHGTPIHHLNWFYKLDELFSPESEIILGKIGDHFVGALLILHYRGRAILHAAVSDPDFRTIPITDRLLWGAFDRIMAAGVSKSFDFGRTRPDPGKLFYKRKWGGKEKTLYYSYLTKPGAVIPQIVPENPKLRLGIKAWQLLPMVVKRRLGPLFRVRIPT